MDFGNLITAVPGLFMTSFDNHKKLLYANTNMAQTFSYFFTTSDYLDVVYAYAKEHDAPYIISNFMGLIWEVILEKRAASCKKYMYSVPSFTPHFLRIIWSVSCVPTRNTD